MKFMAGMMTGAVLILTVAVLAPVTEFGTQARSRAATGWTHLLHGVTDLLFAPPPGSGGTAPGEQAAHRGGPAQTSSGSPAPGLAAEPEPLPLLAEAPLTVPTDPLAGVSTPEAVSESQAQAAPEAPVPPEPQPAAEPKRAATAQPWADDAIVTADVHPHSGTEPPVAFVWQAFHSEISARGFARQLQEILAYPLEVRKQGPARYLVAFTYDSDDQRDALLQEIEQIMGTIR